MLSHGPRSLTALNGFPEITMLGSNQSQGRCQREEKVRLRLSKLNLGKSKIFLYLGM